MLNYVKDGAMNNKKKGLTLVELIVTTCVLLVLVGTVAVGWSFLDRSNRDFDNQMASNYQNALRIYVTNSIRDKHTISLDDAQLVGNAIASVVGQNHMEFTCRTKNYKIYYNPSTLEVVASDCAPTLEFKALSSGDASGLKP